MTKYKMEWDCMDFDSMGRIALSGPQGALSLEQSVLYQRYTTQMILLPGDRNTLRGFLRLSLIGYRCGKYG